MKKLWLVLVSLSAFDPGCRDMVQNFAVPDFFFPPTLVFPGPMVKVGLAHDPFSVSVLEGDAGTERIDANSVRLTSNSGNLSIPLKPGEAIYGLTARIVADRMTSETFVESVGGLDRRGEIVTMWVAPSEALYSPFYISSEGYGMYVEGTNPGTYDIGKTYKDELRLSWYTGQGGSSGTSETSAFSCVFLKGSYLEVLGEYAEATGRPVLPPIWSFLPWKWRDECAPGKFAELDGVMMNAEVAEDISYYEELGFPEGVYLIDRPWAIGNYGYGAFEWDPERFPNGDAMVSALHERGWRVVVWAGPWALGYYDYELGTEARNLGFLMGDRNIDYTNPAAREWHKQKVGAFMTSSDIDGWKLDRGDEYLPSRECNIWYDGRNGLEVHNDYVRLYVKVFYDACRDVLGDDFTLLARPGYTGTTAWSTIFGGDIPGALQGGLVSTDKGLRSAIIGLQRASFLGFPFWGSDTGGYEGFTDRELFARWLEFSAFCPIMEIGGVGEHEPWAMPGEPRYDEEMISIFARYTWLHTELVDYTYQLALRAHDTGNPIVHSLVMDWPGDPAVKDMWDEYMYGPALLVAPIWEIGRYDRDVYLPEGEWFALGDTSMTCQGPDTVHVDVPLDQIAVFVNADEAALLPEDLADAITR
jgi:alpha-glucosidase (family GH31 glycosyl hydrolase)